MNNDITKELLSRRTQALLDIERNTINAARTVEAHKNGIISDKETIDLLEQYNERIRNHILMATTTAFNMGKKNS